MKITLLIFFSTFIISFVPNSKKSVQSKRFKAAKTSNTIASKTIKSKKDEPTAAADGESPELAKMTELIDKVTTGFDSLKELKANYVTSSVEKVNKIKELKLKVDEAKKSLEEVVQELEGSDKTAEGGEAKPAEGGEAKPAEGGEAKPAEGGEEKPVDAK